MFGAALLVAAVNTVLLVIMSYRILLVFQQAGYRVKPFVKWLFDSRAKFFIRLFGLSFISFGLMALKNVLFYIHLDNLYWPIIGVLFYILFSSILIWDARRQKKKIPLKWTPRVMRLTAGIAVFVFAFSFLLLWLGQVIINHWVGFALITITPMLLPDFMLKAHFVLWPYEAYVKQGFVRRAQRKLHSREHKKLIRIGITGSYGKTTCKNILAAMLAKKYKVAVSPASYNTPMGFARTVNEVLREDHQVLIMEMGLRYAHDIQEMCDLVKPHHGLLTSIGTAHIETMGSREAIKIEKAKLVHALPPDGTAVLNGESLLCRQVYDELELENKHLTTLTAKDIRITETGCKFMLYEIECETKLLGRHNVENIIMCAQMAYELGVTPAQIAWAISELEPVPHRLQLTKSYNGVIILDDSYNATVQGTAAALEVLMLFRDDKTGRKLVVQTPGIIELGETGDEANFNYAKEIAKVASDVIVVNETNKKPLLEGLKDAEFPTERTHVAKTLDDAMALYPTLLRPGDVILLANDLPDLFN